jgi:hypothetical protein
LGSPEPSRPTTKIAATSVASPALSVWTGIVNRILVPFDDHAGYVRPGRSS